MTTRFFKAAIFARSVLRTLGAPQRLAVCYFGLMCLGLMLASVFLWLNKLTGTEWVTICGILFPTSRLGDAIERFSKAP